jgi:Carboxypeptidase regulatory-like domain
MGTCFPFLLAILCSLTLVSAQQPQDRFNIAGIVVNSATGKPIARALVQLYGHAMLTSPDGEFSFAAVPAGAAQITLVKPGYFVPGGPGTSIEIGRDTGKIVLKLAPEATIFGRVTGKDEEPLEGARVEALTYVFREGGRRLINAPIGGDRPTDEDGNFKLSGLPAGRYYIAVRAGNVDRRTLGARTLETPVAYPGVVFYPGTKDLAAATAVDLVPGQRMELQLSLTPEPAYKISGTVTTTGYLQAANSVYIVGPMDQPLFSADQFDPRTGKFEFRAVPAGKYTLRVGGSDPQNNASAFSDQTLTVSRPLADLKLLLRPGADIPVVIHKEFDPSRSLGRCESFLPNGERHESDCSEFPAALVELIGLEFEVRHYNTAFNALADPSTLGLHGVSPGKYLVRARANFGGYVQSLRSGSVDLLEQTLTVPENGQVAPIEVVVRDDAAQLKVGLRADPPRRAFVLVIPESAPRAAPQMTSTSSNWIGFETLAPGTYQVFAFDAQGALDYQDPDFLSKYGGKAARVTVAAGGKATVTVDVIQLEE